jgi:predicted metal-dependent hydrolase
LANKETARYAVRKKLESLNLFYHYSYRAVSIRNQKTRWGSCSQRGNLSFNVKILFLPERLQDYLIVHELCHLKELNHSQHFWNLVAQTIPDYAARRRELRAITFVRS